MNTNNPLLSICIPTYNRADKLKISLNAIINAANNFKNIIEIIVSDNCSTDNTQEVVSSFKITHSNLFYYRNNCNLGFNKNIFLLTDLYAKGKYCWLIGDDDYVDIDSITHIINFLKDNENIKLLIINHRFLTKQKYELLSLKNNINLINRTHFHIGTFANAIDEIASPGNLLGTFMSCYIFYKDSFSSFNKEIFSPNSLDNFYSTFPHAYIIASQFINSPVCYNLEPFFTCIPYKKSYDDKMQFFNYKTLPEMYSYYLRIGYKRNQLKRTRKMIIHVNLYDVYLNFTNNRRITKEQIKFCILSFFYPSIYYYLITKVIIKKR